MQRFRGSVLGMLTMLIVQFVLGMAANLFVSITRQHPGANPGNFFEGAAQSVFWAATQSPVVLLLHAILGLLILLNGIVIAVRAFQLTDASVRLFALLGLVGVLAAGFNGAAFLEFNQDVNSFIMSIGFAVAAAFYTQILFVLPAPKA
jgi:hypothetical protein